MMNIRRLSDLVSPQIGAVSGGRQPVLSEESYIEGMASELPQLEEAEYNRNLTEERMQMDREARSQARSDSNTAMGMEAANLGIKAYPYLGKLAAGRAATAIAPTVGSAIADVGLSEFGAASATSGAIAANTAGGVTKAAAGAGTLASMIPGAAGYVGAKIGGDKFTRQVGSLGGMIKDKKTQKRVGGALKGAAAGAAAGAAWGSFLPGPGTVAGGIYGAISGLFSSW